MLKLSTSCFVGKKLVTAQRKDGDTQMVVCELKVKNIRVSRETMDEIANIPIGVSATLFNELGLPHAQTVLYYPKRNMLLTGRVEHRSDSGAATAKQAFQAALIGDIQFTLGTPDESGPTALFGFTVVWKAQGDEVDDIRDILGRNCWIEAELKNEPTTGKLFSDSKPNAAEEQRAGQAARLDRKRRASGEKPEDVTPAPSGQQEFAPPGAKPVEVAPAPATPTKKNGGGLTELERDAREHAARHPRRDPKPAPGRKH